MTLKAIPVIDRLDSMTDAHGKIRTYKLANYTVTNFEYSDHCVDQLDSLVKTLLPENFSEYDHYTIVIYKESAYTNEKHLKENPRDLDRYSNQHDWVYQADWQDGKFFHELIKEGELMNGANDIKIKVN